MIAGGLSWSSFWGGMGIIAMLIAGTLFALLPRQEARRGNDDWIKGTATALGVVFKNPQSILCGLIAGLLFIPTTIFDMIWGVRFLQEARGFDYGDAVFCSATVPFCVVIWFSLLGFLFVSFCWVEHGIILAAGCLVSF